MVYKKSHPPNNKPRPRFASPAVLDDTAAPVEAATLLVALAAFDVADPDPDPELWEAVPEAAGAEEAGKRQSANTLDSNGW